MQDDNSAPSAPAVARPRNGRCDAETKTMPTVSGLKRDDHTPTHTCTRMASTRVTWRPVRVSNTYAAAEWLPAGKQPSTQDTLFDFERLRAKQCNPGAPPAWLRLNSCTVCHSAAFCCRAPCCSLGVTALASRACRRLQKLTYAHKAPVPRVPKAAALAVVGCAAAAAATARYLPFADKLP